ncbi:Type III restriction enzyme, res subunit family protein [Histomonas meleagridis]|uniref:Type III restriction enzyme, res subunit family protein n=1 Tax=Histomonas meleagridis TaxID=135588 RepID=UPI003559FBCD|nr:Type III restriction enzyme, res subunit family protein [Histomonas meleagridis]
MRIKLLIIDEIHLLQDERGPVIEALVARTLRQVEQTQKIIRIIGLSATLPNYQDVANFLHVNKNGLYIFGPEFRPVPLAMTLIGAKNTNLTPKSEKLIYEELYKPGREKDTVQIDCIAIQLLRRIITEKKQVLVFVHTRNETIKFAELIIKYLDIPINSVFNKELKHKNIQGQVKEILSKGVGIHHAGLPRNERIFIENSFRNNSFSILICTATLAWGVNLPAHTVIIKDTKIYNQEYGGYENIGILDVHQMFGRAGRPQFDKDGHGILISTNKVLQRYTTTLINAESIKSNFHTRLEDFLNAEISLGTVTSKQDALKWLHYTFMYQLDPDETHYTEILNYCINELTDNYMIHSSLATESLHPTYLGQIASLHYIPFTSICYFNEKLHINMSEEELLDCIFSSGIFSITFSS